MGDCEALIIGLDTPGYAPETYLYRRRLPAPGINNNVEAMNPALLTRAKSSALRMLLMWLA
jgi:hypothetical protein